MRIVVLDDWSGTFCKLQCYSRLADHEVIVYRDTEKDPLKLAERLQGAQAVILTQQRSHLQRKLVEKLSTIRIVAQTGSHRDHIDFAACTEKGIIIAAPGTKGVGVTTAELTWGLIMASLRHIPQEVENMKRGVWQATAGTGLRGKTLAIYGLGGIGSIVARVGKAFEMRVTCWGREASRGKIVAAGYEMPATRREFFESADVLSLHVYYDEQTRGIVTAADLACMKPTAVFVNTSRDGLIEPGALVDALKKGRPGRAAIDVYDVEPVLNGEHPLLELPNVICTPHLGYATDNMYENFYNKAIDSLLAYAAGAPINVLNPEALEIGNSEPISK